MTNNKNAKRSLLLSALSLLLCVSMLIGSTFAWFTDSVTSAKNKIIAGNLDVELYYKKVVGGALTTEWETVQGESDIFNPDALWEPGRVEVVYLKVSNLGTLALKYQLGVNFEDTVIGKTEKNEDIKLSEHLVFKVVNLDAEPTKPYTREEAIKVAADTAKGLTDYNGTTTALDHKSDDPAVNDEDYVALIVYMPETVGNEANYRGTDVPQIELGINLFATQKDAESDSFGDGYDEDAKHDKFKVTTANDLQAAINNGETNIVLENDIELTESLVIPAATTTYSLRSAPQAITIDLNGKNITTTGANAIYNEGNLVITGKGQISSVSNYAIRVQRGSLLIDSDDISVKSDFGAISVFNGAEVTINGGYYENKGYQDNTSHTIYLGGYGTININGGTFDSGYSNGGIDTVCGYGWSNEANAKAIININGGTFYPSELNGAYYFISNYDGSWTEINIAGGTFHKYNPANISGTKLVDGYKAVDNGDGTYTVLFPQGSFDSLIDNAGASDTIEIPAGSYTFPASKLQAGQTLNCAPGTVFEGKSGLNINGATVIGAEFSNESGNAVSGTINGTFKNCDFTGYNALRDCYAGETVVFENCTFSGDVYGIHFDGGANDAIFKNCTFSGFNAMGNAITLLTMENCTFKANSTSGYNGINLWGNTDMINCTFVFDGTKTEWIDLCSENITGTFTNCVVTDGKTEKGVETVVSKRHDSATICVDGIPVVTGSTDLKAAIAAGATKVLLANGEYDLNGIQKDGLTLIGLGDNVKVANTTKYASGKATGAIWQAINLENVTITNTVYTMADGGKSTFTNVNFAAGFREGYGTSVVFTDCIFGSNSEGYALHFQTDSASEGGLIKLNGCKFEGGKVHLGGKRAYEFTNCDFAAGTDFQVWSNITLDGCTVNGEKVTNENIANLFPNLNAEKVTHK